MSTKQTHQSNEEKIIITCEKCGQKIRIPRRNKTIRVGCPTCHHEFDYQYMGNNFDKCGDNKRRVEVEICQLVLMQNPKREEIFWWEARQPTQQGEKVIFKDLEYADAVHEGAKTWAGAIWRMFFSQTQMDEEIRNSAEQARVPNGFIVAQLAAQG